MSGQSAMPRWLSAVLRPAFGLFLFLAQFTATRGTLFTANVYVLGLGIVLILASFWLWGSASVHLQRAMQQGVIAQTGPYRAIRHPIYTSIYIFSAGLGCLFFAWLWFGVLFAFAPLWYLECREEERQLRAMHGQAYVAYQQRTGMFSPRVGV